MSWALSWPASSTDRRPLNYSFPRTGIGRFPTATSSSSSLVLRRSLKWPWWPGWSAAIIPIIALSLYPAAVIARYTRSSMLEVMNTDYVRTARAKGLQEQHVIIRHAIRNAMLPVITVGVVILADVITGSFYVETVYQVPGIGRYFVDSISRRDYPVILGTVLLFGFIVSVMNLVADLIYPLFDPRISNS